MKVCVVGTGYVGLVTGTCFAHAGHDVWCIDIDERRIADLNENKIPIYEPGLEELVVKSRGEGRLKFSTDISDGLAESDFCFIAVGTPPGEKGEADMAQVMSVADSIGNSMKKPCFIVVKSTVPVGTSRLLCDRIGARLKERGLDHWVEILSNPEFLKEGMAIRDCLNPERVVIGASSDRARAAMKELYAPFVPEEKIIFMDPASAEITKYAANAMLAARISFMNEMAGLCDAVGADIFSVKRGMASDSRIGPYFLNAGCGYGGSCFPKDVQSLCRIGEGQGLDMTLVSAVERVNRMQKGLLPLMLRRRFGEDMGGLNIAVLGLAFKPQTDDMREAPSITLIRSLIEHGASVIAYDPIAMKNAKRILPGKVVFAHDAKEALRGANAAVLVTEWPEFASIDWSAAADIMAGKIVFDGRNLYESKLMSELGFEYYCIGRNHTP